MGLRDFVSYYFTRARADGQATATIEEANGHQVVPNGNSKTDMEMLQREMDEMRRRSEALKGELDAERAAMSVAEQRLQEEEEKNQAMRRELEQKKQESVELADRLHTVESRLTTQEVELLRTKDEADKHVAALAEHQKAHEALVAVHSQLVTSSAETFLSTADDVSEKDVIALVQDVNVEIHKVAQLIADTYKYTAHKIDASQQGVAAREWAEHALGRQMMQLLQETDDPTIVQVAFQGTISMYAHWTARCWYFDLSREAEVIGDIYDDVYYHMRETETVAVARRWRALTRKHIQSVVHGDSDIAASLVPRIAERLTDILLVAGCKAPLKQVTETMKTKFMEKIKAIIVRALKINKVIGQEVLSSDFEVTWVSPEEAYDSTWMDDIDIEQEAGKKDSEDAIRVLGTTELGLGRMEKLVSDAGSEEWKDSCLVKPKVVLESMVEWDGEK
ncbi:hypothetical protein NEOLEDRAFT_1137895 [Neolentinus lepideus HHB14362 ss-1]|uniref:Uncharacterized protein n=1 Tax=Neolentinus lepideus HHB14362 ss-1 TaxID=1314782 RepID=A0A165QHV9_9AGAM|nr:hypothetical protein NEOLEDRAFT_1137895 [Neolentinus lepideus HHB14362 ss-1]